jgi:hypothetical protein
MAAFALEGQASRACGFSKTESARIHWWFRTPGKSALMAMPTSGTAPVARSEPRTRTALLLESIALRHQIAVLERS